MNRNKPRRDRRTASDIEQWCGCARWPLRYPRDIVFDDFRGVACNDGTRRNIFHHDRSGSYHSAVADGDPFEDHGAHPDPDVISDCNGCGVRASNDCVAIPIADYNLIGDEDLLANRYFMAAGYPAATISKTTSQCKLRPALNADRAAAIDIKATIEMELSVGFYNELRRLGRKTFPSLTKAYLASACYFSFNMGCTPIDQSD